MPIKEKKKIGLILANEEEAVFFAIFLLFLMGLSCQPPSLVTCSYNRI
jgi:hypothetical protein